MSSKEAKMMKGPECGGAEYEMSAEIRASVEIKPRKGCQMKLYHGTSKKHLFRILQDGITPRSMNGISNWKKAPSHSGMVYLTDTYPAWFSIKALSEHERVGALIEIDAGR